METLNVAVFRQPENKLCASSTAEVTQSGEMSRRNVEGLKTQNQETN